MAEEVTAYMTSDGSLFECREDAERYELREKIKKDLNEFVRNFGESYMDADDYAIPAYELFENRDKLMSILKGEG